MNTKTFLRSAVATFTACFFAAPLFAGLTPLDTDYYDGEGVYYRVKDGTAAVVTVEPDRSGNAVIASSVTIDGVEYAVTQTMWGAFQGIEELVSIELPETLTKVEGQAFWNCTALEEITFPAGLKMLNGLSFQGCTSLEKVEFMGAAPKVFGANAEVFTVDPEKCDIYVQEGMYDIAGVDDGGSETNPFNTWDNTVYRDMYVGGVKQEKVVSEVPNVGKKVYAGSALYVVTAVDGDNCTVTWSLNVKEPLNAEAIINIPATYTYNYKDDAGTAKTANFTITKIASITNAGTGDEVKPFKDGIKQINFPGEGVTFEEQAFKELTALTSMNSAYDSGIINLPEGMTTIPSGLLLSATNCIEVINVPATVTTVPGNFTFNGSQALLGKLAKVNFLSTTPVTFETTKPSASEGTIFDRQPSLKAISFKSAEAPIINEMTFAAPNLTWNGISMAEDNDSIGAQMQTKDVIVYAPEASVAAYKTAFEGKMGCIVDIVSDKDYDGIAGATVATAQVAAIGDAIIVAGAEAGASVQVYSITGVAVAAATAQGDDLQFVLPAGVYIVAVDGIAYKVIL